MDTYLMMMLVTMDQEMAIRQMFEHRGWKFYKTGSRPPNKEEIQFLYNVTPVQKFPETYPYVHGKFIMEESQLLASLGNTGMVKNSASMQNTSYVTPQSNNNNPSPMYQNLEPMSMYHHVSQQGLVAVSETTNTTVKDQIIPSTTHSNYTVPINIMQTSKMMEKDIYTNTSPHMMSSPSEMQNYPVPNIEQGNYLHQKAQMQSQEMILNQFSRRDAEQSRINWSGNSNYVNTNLGYENRYVNPQTDQVGNEHTMGNHRTEPEQCETGKTQQREVATKEGSESGNITMQTTNNMNFDIQIETGLGLVDQNSNNDHDKEFTNEIQIIGKIPNAKTVVSMEEHMLDVPDAETLHKVKQPEVLDHPSPKEASADSLQEKDIDSNIMVEQSPVTEYQDSQKLSTDELSKMIANYIDKEEVFENMKASNGNLESKLKDLVHLLFNKSSENIPESINMPEEKLNEQTKMQSSDDFCSDKDTQEEYQIFNKKREESLKSNLNQPETTTKKVQYVKRKKERINKKNRNEDFNNESNVSKKASLKVSSKAKKLRNSNPRENLKSKRKPMKRQRHASQSNTRFTKNLRGKKDKPEAIDDNVETALNSNSNDKSESDDHDEGINTANEPKHRWTTSRNIRMHSFHKKCNQIPSDLDSDNFSISENGYFCPDCSYVFKAKNKLQLHKALKGGHCSSNCIYCDKDEFKEIFECSKCPKCFKKKELLEKHEERHKEDAFVCKNCGNGFYTIIDLKFHIQTDHANEEKISHLCDLCGSQFTEKKVLNAHRKYVHTDHRPEECPTCKQRFKTKSQLKNHLVIHKNISDLNLSCEVCGKMFMRAATLRDHVRRHKKEYSQFCKICKKGFYRVSGLDEHMRVHTGLKPFECKLCGYKCALSCNLKKHQRTHNKSYQDTSNPQPAVISHANVGGMNMPVFVYPGNKIEICPSTYSENFKET